MKEYSIPFAYFSILTVLFLASFNIALVTADNWVVIERSSAGDPGSSSKGYTGMFTPTHERIRIHYSFTEDPTEYYPGFGFQLLREMIIPENMHQYWGDWPDYYYHEQSYWWQQGEPKSGIYNCQLLRAGERYVIEVDTRRLGSWSLIVEQDVDSIPEFSLTYILLISILSTALVAILTHMRGNRNRSGSDARAPKQGGFPCFSIQWRRFPDPIIGRISD